MRLIDADHLRRWILSRVFKTQLSVADVIDQIDREDTIEPQRKKGKRIDITMSDYGVTAEPEYEPVTAEDFAKTMSENTLYSFMAWHGKALELMERQGFVICKKTM